MMRLQCEVLHMFGAIMAGSKVSMETLLSVRVRVCVCMSVCTYVCVCYKLNKN